MESGGDGGFGCVWREVDGLAYTDLKGAGAKPAAFAGFEFAEATECYGKDRDGGLFDEQADAGTEGGESAVGRAGAFGEDDDVEASVECFACVGEAALEASAAWEGEDVEERCDEEPCGWAEWVHPLAVAAVAEVFEDLARHGSRGVEADVAGECVEEKG